MFELNPYKQKEKKEIGKAGVEAEFVKAVRLSGGKAFKFVSEMNRGVSDRIVVYPGQMWFVEVKRKSGKLSPLQIEFQKFITSLGLNHFVVYGLEGIKQFIQKVKENDKSGKVRNF
jgi:hypothetical protein